VREFRYVLKNDTCTNKAIYEEGPYYIIPVKDAGVFQQAYQNHYHSLVIHKCGGSAGVYNFTSRIHERRRAWNNKPWATLYLKSETGEVVRTPLEPECGLCNVPIPNTLRTLWTLMNFDSLSEEQ